MLTKEDNQEEKKGHKFNVENSFVEENQKHTEAKKIQYMKRVRKQGGCYDDVNKTPMLLQRLYVTVQKYQDREEKIR